MDKKRILIPFFIFLIIALAVFIRIPYLLLPYMISSGGDDATIGLMIKGISEGNFCTFFYGQAYNGPIEAYIIAPFVILFGFSKMALFFGQMLIYALFLVAIYFLVKEFKNKTAGIFAVIYCALPSFYCYQHSIVLYGYHTTILIFGSIIFLMGLKISKRPEQYLYYIIFGFVSGLGLWNHFSIIYYVIPAVIFLLFKVKFVSLVKGAFIALIPFILGSFPFWAYNFRYNFKSINLYDGHPCVWMPVYASYWQVFKRLINHHAFGLLGVELHHVFGWLLVSIYLLAILNLLNKKNIKEGFLFVLYLILLIVITVRNKYFIWFITDDYRLVLTILPIIAAAVSVAGENLWSRKRWLGALFISILLVINGFYIYEGFLEEEKRLIEKTRVYNQLIRLFEKNNVQGFLSDFVKTQDINYITEGKVAGAELFNGRSPSDIKVDEKDKIALLDCMEVANNTKRICAGWKEKNLAGYNVFYDMKPFEYYGRALDRKNWHVKSNYNNYLVKNAIDSDWNKYWKTDEKKQAGVYFEIDLGGVHKIYKIESLNISPYLWSHPNDCRIEISKDGVHWTLVKILKEHPWPAFWAGPRIYWDIYSGRWEEIFPPVSARYIRITQMHHGGSIWMIDEIFVYEYTGDRKISLKDYTKNSRQIYEFLRENGIDFVYADYWISAKIRKWYGGNIAVLDRENECWPERKNISRMMKIDNKTAIVISAENEGITDYVLNIFNLHIEKKHIGNHVYYLFDNMDKWTKCFSERQKCLFWTGFCPVGVNFRTASNIFVNYALSLPESNMNERIYYFKCALKLYSKNVIARKMLCSAKKDEEKILKHKFIPRKNMDIEFVNGVKFKGYTIRQVGKKMQISYFWEISKDIDKNIVVFVHFFKDSRIVFQNDHRFLEQYDESLKPVLDEIFVERYWVNIPEPGEYKVVLGLCLPGRGKKRFYVKGTGLNKASKVYISESLVLN